jgi:hypothetical protein
MYIHGMQEKWDIEITTGMIYSPQISLGRYRNPKSRRGIIEKVLNMKNDNKI